MFERGQEERTELSLFPCDITQVILLQESREELLGQILSIVWCMALALNVSIQRRPVSTAELLHRVLSLGRTALADR